ncbi:hypothetical protein HK405_015787 [Cladochytrium tenue]|nr:hypothetical protein HK405_015787 [Cladochytrium tenue]
MVLSALRSTTAVTGVGEAPADYARMEVVMSHFDEDLGSAAKAARLFMEYPSIRERSPRLVVYTKDQEANLTELRALFGTPDVTRLPNVGREGHTFLHHLAARYDQLAAHTLFVQAHPHRMFHTADGDDLDFTRVRDDKMARLDWLRLEGAAYIPLGTFAPVVVNIHSFWLPRLREMYVLLNGEFAPKHMAAPPGHGFHADVKVFRSMSISTPSNPVFGHDIERVFPILFWCHDPALFARCANASELCGCYDDDPVRWPVPLPAGTDYDALSHLP